MNHSVASVFSLVEDAVSLLIATFCLTEGECFPEGEGEHYTWSWACSELWCSPESQWPRARSWVTGKHWLAILPSTFTMPLHGGKEPPLWSGESETFQPIREQTGVLQPQMQEEAGTLETSSSTSLIAELGERLRKEKWFTQGHTAGVVRTSLLAGKSEHAYSVLLLWQSQEWVKVKNQRSQGGDEVGETAQNVGEVIGGKYLTRLSPALS